MSIIDSITSAFGQAQAGNLAVTLVLVVLGIIIVRFFFRAVVGGMMFRFRRMILLALIGVFGGAPLFGLGGISSLNSMGAGTAQYLCNGGYSAGYWLSSFQFKPIQRTGHAVTGFTGQICSR